MSIVIALGVTTPETSYSDMAAGSDPESVEASPAVNEKNYNNQSCGSAQNHGYQGLPYADHNYGAPPPPTPPASPLSQTIIPRMDLNGVVRSSRYHETTEDNSADSDSSSEEDGAVPSWCRCSPAPDGLHSKCQCRELDRRKGAEHKHRKPENISAGESSATESGDEEVSPSTISYTATQHTPTSIKLTVNRVKSRKSKKRKKNTEKARGTPKVKKVKAFREGSRKSMRMKNSTTEASVLDENTAEGWESRIRQWTDQYEEAQANQYSADIQTLLQLHRSACSTVSKVKSGTTTPPPSTQNHAPVDSMDTISRTELACNNTVLGSQMQLQLGRVTRVQIHRKILRAAKNLEPDTLIIEYRGKVMLRQQFEVNGHFFKKPYPFVLFYSKFNDVEMCVDARTFGNDARFIRRSCTPNAEVRHMIAEGMIHLCIYAISQITKDSEVTIGFDYEFSNCNYKVDCACHKGNQNCPVQKHNLSPRENLLSPPTLALPSPPVGAETRRRKAQRKELESCLLSSSSSSHEQQQGSSDTEEKTQDGIKVEEGEEGDVEENGILISSKRTLSSLDRRRRAGGAEVKDEGVEAEDAAGNPTETPSLTGVGVSTRRTSYVTEAPPVEEKFPPTTLPALAAPPKPVRPTKPRSKSRISRYRSSSSQRARRQRQALAQQAAAAAAAAMAAAQAAADQGAAQTDEGSQGPYGSEHGDCNMGGGGHLLDGDSQGPNSMHRGSVRFPKTKKYLVTEWLNDKIPGGEKLPQEVPVERPLRITTDPTVLATTLNMLPGLSHTSLICTAPRHYVRFGSPFNPERHRPRPLQMDGTYGCYKKRWIKQVEDESCSASVEDGTESTSSQQSTSSRSTPNPLCSEVNAPFKKRHHKYLTETTPAPSDHLLRPLSPITPPLPEDSLHPLLHTPRGLLLPNGLAYSPMTSLPPSRCNTPLQFENISSPEASPVHRQEPVSPEADFDPSRPQFLDLSLPSSMESPVAVTSDDFSLPGVVSGQDSQGQSSVGGSGPASDSQNREQAFRTEFNLIYTCSPLNANLGNPVGTDRHPPQVDGGFSPADSVLCSNQGLVGDLGSASPFAEPHYGAGYTDCSTPPHTSNPPQKKKRANQQTVSLLTGKAQYEAIAVRSANHTVQNMVSLLEYRKRKQGGGRDSELTGGSSHARPGSFYSKDSHHSQSPASPQHSFSSSSSSSSSAHTAPVPHVEEVSPPDQHGLTGKPKHQESNNQWMVPTTVERLREGQGGLERVLRSIKMERVYKRSDGSTERESDADGYKMPAGSVVSSTKSPLRYSPPIYQHQSTEVLQQTESPSFTYSPPSGQSFYPRLSSSYSSPTPPFVSDPRHQQSGGSSVDGGSHGFASSHLKTSTLGGAPASGPRAQGQTKTELGHQQASDSPVQAGLEASCRPSHGLAQFQGAGVRTQSGSF
ncbi:histone-lysine N-methyltransferase SETD5 isoform X2 [Kryptolebias marmoratus]|uniref:histone-lysine N-methyltransferase SETD5 isoform X2 n=1 Tax=Kryptolebias marmoratus TaxID=37003 RepID=UPI0007F8A668|nr:histone-lysine N-methyltransferase SETD5 isoform X2 [Kryptolebias marmoratus]